MKNTADVVIIGGGCMGTSVAYHLAQRGVTNVVLVEREALLGMGSTGRNAGGVRHQFSNEVNIRLSIESIGLLERFKEEVGRDVDFHQDGYLFLLSTPARHLLLASSQRMKQVFRSAGGAGLGRDAGEAPLRTWLEKPATCAWKRHSVAFPAENACGHPRDRSAV